MDIGTTGHTAFEFGPEMMEPYERNPELMNCRLGLIHSHNTMTTFFSGEDWEELEDNAENTDFYVSLIVNNASKYSAKAAFRSDTEVEVETTSWFKGKALKFNEKIKRKSIYTVNLDVEIEFANVDISDTTKRIEEIQEKIKLEAEAAKIKKVAEYQQSPKKYAARQVGMFDKLSAFNLINETKDINSEEEVVADDATLDNFFACLLMADVKVNYGMVAAMRNVKTMVLPDIHTLYIDQLNDNIEDIYEQFFGELCHMEAYMDILSKFRKELLTYSDEAYPIVKPLVEALTINLGDVDANGVPVL